MRKEIGPIASPDLIQFAPSLPKTRSGKIMRRILRKIAENEFGALGDTSTLADPGVVTELIDAAHRKEHREHGKQVETHPEWAGKVYTRYDGRGIFSPPIWAKSRPPSPRAL